MGEPTASSGDCTENETAVAGEKVGQLIRGSQTSPKKMGTREAGTIQATLEAGDHVGCYLGKKTLRQRPCKWRDEGGDT